MRIVGLTGPMGSGKTTVANYLVQSYKFYYSSLSDILVEEANKHGLSERRQIIEFGRMLRDREGYDILARRVWDDVRRQQKNLYVVDGIRYSPEADFFRQQSPLFTLLGINCSQSLRLERTLKRLRFMDSDVEELRFCDEEELSFGLEETLNMSDDVIDNSSISENELKTEVDKFLESLYIYKHDI